MIAVTTCAAFGYMAVSGAVATNHTTNNTTTATEQTQEVEQSITPSLDLVRIEELSGDRAVLVIRSDVPQSVTLTDARSEVLVSEIYTVSDGTTRITYDPDNGQVGRLYLGASGRAEFIGNGGGSNLINLDQYSGNLIPYTILGASVGTMASIVAYYSYKRRKLLNGFHEWITGEYVEKPAPWELSQAPDADGRLERIWNRAKLELGKTRTKLLALLGAGIAIQQYYGITPSDIPIWVYAVAASALVIVPVVIVVWPKLNERYDIFRVESDVIADLGNYDSYYDGDATPDQIDSGAIDRVESLTDLPVHFFECHPSLVRDININGERRSWPIPGGTLHIVDSFDPRNLEAEAADVAEVPEHEMMRLAAAVVEHKARANLFVRFGRRAYRSFTSIASKVEEAHHNEMSRKERDMELYNAENIEEQLRGEFPELEALSDDGQPVSEEYRKLMNERDDSDPEQGGDDK